MYLLTRPVSTLNSRSPSRTPDPTGPVETIKAFAGTWSVIYSNNIIRVYTVTEKGQVTWE